MEAKDLRIGNWFEGDNGDKIYYRITAKQILDFYDDPLDDYYKPIPLTEDWLLNYGFEKVIYESDDFGYETNYELDIKGVGYISYSDDFSCALFGSKESSKNELGFLPNWDNCKYVHQLQNLYFALTGEELTLKK